MGIIDKELDSLDKIAYIVIILFICLLYAQASIIQVNTFGEPWGDDYKLHSKIVDGWIAGDNPLTDERYFGNSFPYPPAFHLTIAVLSKILAVSPVKIFNFLQVLIFPIVLLSTYYLVRELKGAYTATVTVLLLHSGFAFGDRALQLIPNAIDVALMPLITMAYLRTKKRTFIVLATYLIYNHFLYSLVLMCGLLAYSIVNQRGKLGAFGYIVLFCAPLFLLYALYIPEFVQFGTSAETQIGQYILATTKPLYSIAYYGYFLFGFSIIGIVHFLRKELSEFEKIILYWAAVLVPLVVIFPHRGLPYIAQPMAAVSAITLSDYANTRNKRNVLLLFLLVITMMYTVVKFNYCPTAFASFFTMFKSVLFYY